MLVVLSGLSGVGKTTIARELARATGAVHLRIDSIEQALRNAGWRVEGEGYRVAYALAEDNLRVGRVVIADCVNPWLLTRDAWRAVGQRAGVPVVDVEIVCSDAIEHRRRVESRQPDIEGHKVPAWSEVVERDYRPWQGERLVIDTARLNVEQSVRAIRSEIAKVPSEKLDITTSNPIIAAVEAWQADAREAMTCANDRNHRPLIAVERHDAVYLRCLDCDYVQAHVPDIVLRSYKPSRTKPKE